MLSLPPACSLSHTHTHTHTCTLTLTGTEGQGGGMASVDLAPQEARPAYRSGALDVSAGTCTFSWENRSALFERAVSCLSLSLIGAS